MNEKEIYEGDIFQVAEEEDYNYMYISWDNDNSLYRFYIYDGEFKDEPLDEVAMWILSGMRITGNVKEGIDNACIS